MSLLIYIVEKGKAGGKNKDVNPRQAGTTTGQALPRETESGTGGWKSAVFTPLLLRDQIKARAANHKQGYSA